MSTTGSHNRQMVIAAAILCGVIAIFAWYSGPRLVRDFRHAGDFISAQGHRITDAKCTNWNGGIVSECTVKFTAPNSQASQEITDWRFGSAPEGRVQLMQRRGDATALTTDVSLATLSNRMALALTLLLGGGVLAIALMKKAMKPAEAPPGAAGWAEEALRKRGMG
jgi:hypothetical protein